MKSNKEEDSWSFNLFPRTNFLVENARRIKFWHNVWSDSPTLSVSFPFWPLQPLLGMLGFLMFQRRLLTMGIETRVS